LHVCHLFLALPLLALPVFWLWPWPVALPLNASVVALSLVVYAYAWKTWRLPRVHGFEAMLGRQGQVVAVGAADVTLQPGNELWSARVAGEQLRVGDNAVVVGAESLVLRVRRAAGDPRPADRPARGQGSNPGSQPRSE
jgi:membrane protein implicated in regulation of membrane protease activity